MTKKEKYKLKSLPAGERTLGLFSPISTEKGTFLTPFSTSLQEKSKF